MKRQTVFIGLPFDLHVEEWGGEEGADSREELLRLISYSEALDEIRYEST